MHTKNLTYRYVREVFCNQNTSVVRLGACEANGSMPGVPGPVTFNKSVSKSIASIEGTIYLFFSIIH